MRVNRIIIEDGAAVGVEITDDDGTREIMSPGGVICNAPIWSLPSLISPSDRQNIDGLDEFLSMASDVEMTRSYHHLHVALDSSGLDLGDLPPPHHVL